MHVNVLDVLLQDSVHRSGLLLSAAPFNIKASSPHVTLNKFDFSLIIFGKWTDSQSALYKIYVTIIIFRTCDMPHM